MYSANYGFGNAAPNFNPPAGAPQPGMQPGGMQPGQQAMFNRQQQFAGMAPQGVFPGANPHMMQDASAAMMQGQGMPGMAPNNQMAYQQQFPGASYGQVLPGSVGPQGFVPNNYMMGPGMQGFPMGQPGMPQQAQMIQRMQQQQQQQQPQQPQQQQQQQQLSQQQQNQMMAQVSTPQRPPSTTQGTPTNIMPPQQPQFSTPQPMSQGQTPTAQHQPQMGVAAPQTPTFSSNPASSMAAPSSAVPMSPTTESLEKERFALLLDINHELLYESIQIQTTQQELKKEFVAVNGNVPDRKPTEEESQFQHDYLHCMRRLQGNLSYMAALADRKPDVKLPPCPPYLSAPPLNMALKLRAMPIGAENSTVPVDPVADREERNKSIQDLYRRLQAVFPEHDPKNEPAYRTSASGQKPGNPMAASQQASPAAQRTPQLSNMPGPPMNSQAGVPMQ